MSDAHPDIYLDLNDPIERAVWDAFVEGTVFDGSDPETAAYLMETE